MQRWLLLPGLLLSSGMMLAQQSTLSADTGTGSAPVEPKALRSFDLTAIDKTVDPCVDFYQYACGNWRRNNPIPNDQARWGTFNELAERNRYLLYTELKQAADTPKSPLQKQYGDFFAACMDTDKVDALGEKPLLPTLAAIDALADKKAIARLIADKKYMAGGFVRFGEGQDQKDSTQQIAEVYQGGLSLPDRDYYLATDERMTKIRTQYVEYATKLFTLMGESPDQAAADAKTVLTIETELAKGSMPRVEMRNPDNIYHPMPVADLKALTPEFNWTAYIEQLGAPSFQTLNVAQPSSSRP